MTRQTLLCDTNNIYSSANYGLYCMAATTSSTRFEYGWTYSPRVSILFGLFTGVAVFGWVVSAFLSGIHF